MVNLRGSISDISPTATLQTEQHGARSVADTHVGPQSRPSEAVGVVVVHTAVGTFVLVARHRLVPVPPGRRQNGRRCRKRSRARNRRSTLGRRPPDW